MKFKVGDQVVVNYDKIREMDFQNHYLTQAWYKTFGNNRVIITEICNDPDYMRVRLLNSLKSEYNPTIYTIPVETFMYPSFSPFIDFLTIFKYV